jgi:hypothetical protein
MKINKTYFTLTLLLFLTEVLIALYVRDSIIRPYGGDYLVVILIYCSFKSFGSFPVYPTGIAVLLFSYIIEVLQYFKLIYLLGLEHSVPAKILIGTSFAWTDLVAYTLGIATVFIVEKIRLKYKPKPVEPALNEHELFC